MTPNQIWLANQTKEFLAGYDAYCLCEPFDKSKSQEWQNGWLCAADQHEE